MLKHIEEQKSGYLRQWDGPKWTEMDPGNGVGWGRVRHRVALSVLDNICKDRIT